MENLSFKIVIKPIKPKKPKETDPVKIEAMKEKRRLQREARKAQGPKEPKEPKPDYTNQLEVINKTLKNIVGLNIDEINQKLKPLQAQANINNEKNKK